MKGTSTFITLLLLISYTSKENKYEKAIEDYV
jgi:hypothetical protein